MTRFGPAIDALFRNPVLGVDAIWRAAGTGAPVQVRVILRAPDRLTSFGEGQFVADSILVDLRVGEVPNLARNDTIQIGATVHRVISDPVRDSERLVWTVTLRPV